MLFVIRTTSSTHKKMKKGDDNKDDRNANEMELTQKLVEVTDAVRKKFNSIKNKHMENQVALEKIYEPITKPLKHISETALANRKFQSPTGTQPKISSFSTPIKHKTMHTEMEDEDVADSFPEEESPYQLETPPSSLVSSSGNKNVSEYVKNYIIGLKAGETAFDTIYGIYIDSDSGKLMMGNAEVRFLDRKVTLWRAGKQLKSYVGNSQLYDLLFLKLPPDVSSKGQGISDENMRLYEEILNITNAAYKNYDIKLGYRSSKSKKYNEVIKPLLTYRMTLRSTRGSGLMPTRKIYTHKSIDYVYWNKPKELVDRLRLLWSSKTAGHSGHDNEILSLIEELREEGVIF